VPTDSPSLLAADVAMDVRTAGSGGCYTYAADERIQVGSAVIVPLGNRQALGFVLRIFEATEESLGYPVTRLKPIDEVVDGLSLPEAIVELVEFTAREFLSPLSVAISPAIPPGAFDRLERKWQLVASESSHDLTQHQKELLAFLNDQGGELSVTGRKKLDAPTEKALRLLKSKGLVKDKLAVGATKESKASAHRLQLTPDAQAIESFLKTESKRKPAQALTLLRLQEIESSALAPADIKALCGVTDATIKQLVAVGLLQKFDPNERPPTTPPPPNHHQQIAIDALCDAVQRQDPQTFLLFGVTGSGKTEVYLHAAAEALRQGRQVLYLVPEIALATQAVWQLRERFGKAVAIVHSELTPTERLSNWMAIRSGQAAVVLGARSALFAPLENLGLIVMDEEHEQSYKQESGSRYHAKRLARFLAQRHRCPLVLGSATPSVESFYEAEQEQMTLLSLPQRAASATLPEVHIVDLAEGYRKGAPAMFSELLADKMVATHERHEQTILFLNRRAYAPFLICRDCGHQFMCSNCSVSLTFSRKLMKLRCHHCGHQERPPDLCPQCNGNRLNPFGVGTEKVEEAVHQLLPSARIARLDRDVAQRRGALEEILAAFGAGEIDVLVGTQMVAKGLNFPGVTLVGVIAADMSLNIPDFRATERTFQLLSQVSGRAGRGSKPGEVVIQTFNPDHIAIQATKQHNFVQLYDELKAERQAATYPPFTRLVNVVVSGASLHAVTAMAESVAADIRNLKLPSIEVLGPTECALERLNNLWRHHLLLKLSQDVSPSDLASCFPQREIKGLQVMIDVDPYSML
jgi:primosomal protein N' (replication factor Y)